MVVAYAPWRMTYSRLEDALEHPWVRYHVPHPIRGQVWMFTDIDETLRASMR